MQDPAIDDAGYEWPCCVSCHRKLWEIELDRLVCWPCEDRTQARIGELAGLFRKLDQTAALMKGARRATTGGSGTRTAPIPARLDVLALVGPGGVAARLSAIEDAWRKALGWTIAPWRGSPAQAVPVHVEFIVNNLLWACGSYEEVGQDIDVIGKLYAECKAITDDERRPGRVQIGNCPTVVEGGVCWAPLTARADSHRVRCGNCNSAWETLGEWRELRAAQERVLAEAAGAAA